MRQRHGQAEARRVERRPAGPDEVGRHQGLAVAGRERVAGARAPPRSGSRGAARPARGRPTGRSTAGRRCRRRPAPTRRPPRDRRRRARPSATATARGAADGPATASTGAAPASGVASGMSKAASVGPPGVAVSVDGRSSSGLGQQVRRVVRSGGADVLVVRSSPAVAARVDAEPVITISRQPRRSGERACPRRRSGVPAPSGAASVHVEAAHQPHRGEAADAGRERETRLGRARAPGVPRRRSG